MDYLRLSAKISRMDSIRNDRIRTKMVHEERHVTEEQQLRWYGHVMLMEDGRIARDVAEGNTQGRRRRGRPVSTWKDGIRDNKQNRKLKDQECFDRQLWRKKIMSFG
jgi:hypothetical protein